MPSDEEQGRVRIKDEERVAEDEEVKYPGPWVPLAFFLALLAVALFLFACGEALEGDGDPEPIKVDVLTAASVLLWAAASVSLVVGLNRARVEPGFRLVDLLILAIGFSAFAFLV